MDSDPNDVQALDLEQQAQEDGPLPDDGMAADADHLDIDPSFEQALNLQQQALE